MSSLISDKKKAENLAKAEEAYAKAQKKAKTSLLRWKPDWEQAARFYREAVKFYRISGAPAATIQALRESAVAHREIGSYHTAAADLEAAATMTKDDRHDTAGAAELYKEASELYRLHGASHDKASLMLVKSAECLGECGEVNRAVELMKEACGIFEEEGKGVFHDATFKKAISFCVNKEKFGSARALLQRQIAIQRQHLNPFEADIYKNCLAIVVLRLHTNQPEKAAESLREFENIERFARSEECLAANELIAAWEDGSDERWAETLKKNVFKYLLNPIAVIARKLEMPDGAGKGAGAAGGQQLDQEEEEGEVDLR